MKRIFISALLIATSSVALAATTATGSGKAVATPSTGNNVACDGNIPGGGRAIVWGGSGYVLTDAEKAAALFTRSGFDLQCSNNTHVSWAEPTTNYGAVASGSVKGNQTFGGHSNGGVVAASAKCQGTNDACGTGDVTTALTKAVTDGAK